MKKTFIIFAAFLLIFILSDDVFAVCSGDDCVCWVGVCNEPTVIMNLSWEEFTQDDVDQLRGDCILSSASYTVEIIGLGTRSAGVNTNYTWEGLSLGTDYQWSVTTDYQCMTYYNSGSVSTDLYTLTTPDCNDPPDKPVTTSVEAMNHCSIQGISVPTFEWTYSDPEGDPQQGYEIRIDDDPTFTMPGPDPDEFTASGGSSTSYTPVPSEWADWQEWSTNYWWIVRVQDNYGNWSDWSNINPFNTPSHAYPWVDFSPSPQNPVAGEVVEFIQNQSGVAETLCYDGGEHLCEIDSSVTYEWDLSYNSGDGFITDSFNKGNTTTSYATVEPIEIRLRVTDNSLLGSNKSCTGSEMINVEFPLPEYEEVSPAVFLKKALVNLFDFFKGFVLLSNPEG